MKLRLTFLGIYFLNYFSLNSQNCICDYYSINQSTIDSLMDIADYKKAISFA